MQILLYISTLFVDFRFILFLLLVQILILTSGTKFLLLGGVFIDNSEMTRSWFCVFNNPDNVFSGTPEEIAQSALDLWIDGHTDTRTGAVTYCISAEGLHHLHMVLESHSKIRFSALKKIYPSAHLEPTKGTKEQAEDYIQKKGKFKEKGEQVLYVARFGEIKGSQGQRKDIEILQDLIDEGKTPNEIFDIDIRFRRYDKMISDAFFRKRYKETPIHRDLNVFWHIGVSGSGKTYTYVKLCEKYGEDNVYLITDYSNPFDKYNGEPIIFLDEFKGQLKFTTLLNTFLSPYRVQIPCRYSNRFSLWREVHIATVFTPEMCYHNMVTENKNIDNILQLIRRINTMVYHFIDDDGNFREFEQPMKEYADLDTLKELAENSLYLDIPELDIFTDDDFNPIEGQQIDFNDNE